jgi:hypothetical protein
MDVVQELCFVVYDTDRIGFEGAMRQRKAVPEELKWRHYEP